MLTNISAGQKMFLIFNETPISEILKKIGRYYNVEFQNSTNETFNEKTCSGKLFLSSDLDSVMTSITHITSTTYNRTDNIININKLAYKKNNKFQKKSVIIWRKS